jgi:hypothetical protein
MARLPRSFGRQIHSRSGPALHHGRGRAARSEISIAAAQWNAPEKTIKTAAVLSRFLP